MGPGDAKRNQPSIRLVETGTDSYSPCPCFVVHVVGWPFDEVLLRLPDTWDTLSKHNVKNQGWERTHRSNSVLDHAINGVEGRLKSSMFCFEYDANETVKFACSMDDEC